MDMWKPLFQIAHTKVFDFLKCSGRTIRIVVPVNASGTGIRIRFSNEYGSDPIELSGITLAESDQNGFLDQKTLCTLCFNGREKIILPPGQEAVSDQICVSLTRGKWLAVSMYFPDGVSPRSGNCTKGCSYRSVPGDYRTEATFEMDNRYENEGKVVDFLPLFKAAEIFTDREDLKVLGLIGDSISTGVGGSWFNRLSQDLRENCEEEITFVNAGIPGNRLLKDSPECLPEILGPAGIRRFEKDVPCGNAVTHCIFALGINDLLYPETPMESEPLPEPEDFLKAYTDMVSAAKSQDIKTAFVSILPCGNRERFDQKKEILRRKINALLKASEVFDLFLDCDEDMLDAGGFGMKQEYTQPDKTHLSEAGADAVYRCFQKYHVTDFFSEK